MALFAQLGGGIYTKAADVGADLVGKVEAGIPEDDPRNPAVIADLVGDNVGDCAGRGADLFESTAAENIGAMILGVALFPIFGIQGIMFPLVARALGLIASIIGIMTVRGAEDEDPMASLNRGYYIATGLATVGFFLATWQMLGELLVLVLPRRADRHHHQLALRLHHRILYRISLPSGPIHRRIVTDGTGHQYHHWLCRRA